MSKQYREIDFGWCNIEEAVKQLIEHKNNGNLVCGVFNGKTLYSDTVTIDSAYKEITGLTKIDYDKKQQEWKEERKRQEKEHKDSIPEQAKLWMKKGREILAEDKWDYWDEVVPIRLNDLYRGMELGSCLDIVEVLNNNESLEFAKATIENQNHSGMSFGLVCAIVKELCERGEEFVNYVK